jgi:hypothetical protein
MFIVYKKGEILNQIVAWGADKERPLEGGYFAAPGGHIKLFPPYLQSLKQFC